MATQSDPGKYPVCNLVPRWKVTPEAVQHNTDPQRTNHGVFSRFCSIPRGVSVWAGDRKRERASRNIHMSLWGNPRASPKQAIDHAALAALAETGQWALGVTPQLPSTGDLQVRAVLECILLFSLAPPTVHGNSKPTQNTDTGPLHAIGHTAGRGHLSSASQAVCARSEVRHSTLGPLASALRA